MKKGFNEILVIAKHEPNGAALMALDQKIISTAQFKEDVIIDLWNKMKQGVMDQIYVKKTETNGRIVYSAQLRALVPNQDNNDKEICITHPLFRVNL
jgi:hypothetical protein